MSSRIASNCQRRCLPLVLLLATISTGWAQEEAEGEPDELRTPGGLIDFTSDVYPIFQAKCLNCHGPEDAKNDFRIDDSEYVLSYLEPGDVEGSSLWVDYLVTDDPDMRMPPPTSHGDEMLTGAELATIRLWIEEGAEWEEPIDGSPEAAGEAAQKSRLPETLAERIWVFQGLFHPATVHFPVALLTVSTAFVLLSFFCRDSCEPVAFHCLWIGALGAIIASIAGWSFATHEGYGASYSFDIANSSIDRHRWLGIGVAVLAVLLIPLAASVRSKGGIGKRLFWLLGSLLLLVAVSITGYQGGELTYGEDHYVNEYQRLFPSAVEDPEPVDEAPLDEAPLDEEPVDESAEMTEAETDAADQGETESAELDSSSAQPDAADPPPVEPASEPEPAEDAEESGTVEPVVETQPETTEPDATEPDATAPETTDPETTDPETTEDDDASPTDETPSGADDPAENSPAEFDSDESR